MTVFMKLDREYEIFFNWNVTGRLGDIQIPKQNTFLFANRLCCGREIHCGRKIALRCKNVMENTLGLLNIVLDKVSCDMEYNFVHLFQINIAFETTFYSEEPIDLFNV